jgi:hypothetical protein
VVETLGREGSRDGRARRHVDAAQHSAGCGTRLALPERRIHPVAVVSSTYERGLSGSGSSFFQCDQREVQGTFNRVAKGAAPDAGTLSGTCREPRDRAPGNRT